MLKNNNNSMKQTNAIDIKMINRTIARLDFGNGVCVYVCITKTRMRPEKNKIRF